MALDCVMKILAFIGFFVLLVQGYFSKPPDEGTLSKIRKDKNCYRWGDTKCRVFFGDIDFERGTKKRTVFGINDNRATYANSRQTVYTLVYKKQGSKFYTDNAFYGDLTPGDIIPCGDSPSISLANKKSFTNSAGETRYINFMIKVPLVNIDDRVPCKPHKNFMKSFFFDIDGIRGATDLIVDLDKTTGLFRFTSDTKVVNFVSEGRNDPLQENVGTVDVSSFWRNLDRYRLTDTDVKRKEVVYSLKKRDGKIRERRSLPTLSPPPTVCHKMMKKMASRTWGYEFHSCEQLNEDFGSKYWYLCGAPGSDHCLEDSEGDWEDGGVKDVCMAQIMNSVYKIIQCSWTDLLKHSTETDGSLLGLISGNSKESAAINGQINMILNWMGNTTKDVTGLQGSVIAMGSNYKSMLDLFQEMNKDVNETLGDMEIRLSKQEFLMRESKFDIINLKGDVKSLVSQLKGQGIELDIVTHDIYNDTGHVKNHVRAHRTELDYRISVLRNKSIEEQGELTRAHQLSLHNFHKFKNLTDKNRHAIHRMIQSQNSSLSSAKKVINGTIHQLNGLEKKQSESDQEFDNFKEGWSFSSGMSPELGGIIGSISILFSVGFLVLICCCCKLL